MRRFDFLPMTRFGSCPTPPGGRGFVLVEVPVSGFQRKGGARFEIVFVNGIQDLAILLFGIMEILLKKTDIRRESQRHFLSFEKVLSFSRIRQKMFTSQTLSLHYLTSLSCSIQTQHRCFPSFSWPAKTTVSPRSSPPSSPLGTFRENDSQNVPRDEGELKQLFSQANSKLPKRERDVVQFPQLLWCLASVNEKKTCK